MLRPPLRPTCRLAVAAVTAIALAGSAGAGRATQLNRPVDAISSPQASSSRPMRTPSMRTPAVRAPVSSHGMTGRRPLPPGASHHHTYRSHGGRSGSGLAIGIGAAVAIGAAIAASQAAAEPDRAAVTDAPPRRPPRQDRPRQVQAPPAPRFAIAAGETRFVPDEVLVEMATGLGPAAIAAIERRTRLVRLGSEPFTLLGRTLYHYRIADGRAVPAVLAQLSRERQIAFAQPNWRFATPRATYKLAEAAGAAADAIDPALLYAARALRLAEAHQLARGDKVLVAVIDSAVDPGHPELAGALRDVVDVTGVAEPARPHGHGTAMAGAVAAHARLVGAAPAAGLLAVTAFRPEGEGAGGTTVTVLRGLDVAFAAGARVVNMSFAGPRDALLSRALAAARERGLILIAAAGNAGPASPPLYPGADPGVIAVTATDADDAVFAEANRGGHITVAAPGVDVLVPGPEGAYAFTSGTSVAAAYVSGVVALMLERNPTLSAAAARAALAASARDLGAKGRDEVYGAGEADAYGAIRRLDRRTAGP